MPSPVESDLLPNSEVADEEGRHYWKSHFYRQRALEALLVSKSVPEAAEYAGMTTATIYSYLRDAEFQNRLAEAQQHNLIDLGRQLLDASFLAVTTLTEVLEDPDSSTVHRLKAADSILKHVSAVHNQAINEARFTMALERVKRALAGDEATEDVVRVIDQLQQQ